MTLVAVVITWKRGLPSPRPVVYLSARHIVQSSVIDLLDTYLNDCKVQPFTRGLPR